MGARLSYPEVNQSGRVSVVTGGNTGIGYETAKGLAVLGAHVVIACRSEERAKNVSSSLLYSVPASYMKQFETYISVIEQTLVLTH